MKHYFFLILFFFTIPLFAQVNDQEYLTEYKKAVAYFKKGDFEKALDNLDYLLSLKVKNPVAPYAHLYGAISAEEAGKRYQSKLIFRKLFSEYPSWDKIDNAKFLYAKQNFEDGYFEEGMKAVDSIKDSDLQLQKLNLVSSYIDNVSTITALKSLYEKYPTYQPIAEALILKIKNNRYNTKADLELSDILTNRFNLTKDIGTTYGGQIKATNNLNFGLLLPFNTNTDATPESSNRYIFDIYAGMQIAADKLKEEGINLNIHTYDVRNNAESFKSAEKKTGFKNLDLIVGPLYATPNNLAGKFIEDNEVIQVHPISNNVSLVENAKNSYLFQPSFARQALKTIEYVSAINSVKTVDIYYGPASKDRQFANAYAKVAEENGFKVTNLKRYEENDNLDEQSGHIFFVGDNNLGSQFLIDVNKSKIECNIFLTANSFNWYNIDPSIFKDNIALIYPEFIDSNKESVIEFEKLYFDKNFTLPSYYSYLGHDLAYYFAKKIEKGKSIMEINLRLQHRSSSDYLLSGFDYADGKRQNNIVPIVKFIDNQFEEVSR